jgi:hypothetical protein
MTGMDQLECAHSRLKVAAIEFKEPTDPPALLLMGKKERGEVDR